MSKFKGRTLLDYCNKHKNLGEIIRGEYTGIVSDMLELVYIDDLPVMSTRKVLWRHIVNAQGIVDKESLSCKSNETSAQSTQNTQNFQVHEWISTIAERTKGREECVCPYCMNNKSRAINIENDSNKLVVQSIGKEDRNNRQNISHSILDSLQYFNDFILQSKSHIEDKDIKRIENNAKIKYINRPNVKHDYSSPLTIIRDIAYAYFKQIYIGTRLGKAIHIKNVQGFDIIIPELRVCINIERSKPTINDKKKQEICKQEGIGFIRIIDTAIASDNSITIENSHMSNIYYINTNSDKVKALDKILQQIVNKFILVPRTADFETAVKLVAISL